MIRSSRRFRFSRARLAGLIAVLLWTAAVCGLPAFAADPDLYDPDTADDGSSAIEMFGPHVFDKAGLMTDAEIAALEERITDIRAKTEIDLVILTIDDAEGKTSMEYADDFYDGGLFGVGASASGVLFLIDLDNSEAWISTSGRAITQLSDATIDKILDDAYEGLSSGDFYAAAESFLDGADRYLKPVSQPASRPPASKPASEGAPLKKDGIISMLGAIAAAFFFYRTVKRRYQKPPKRGNAAAEKSYRVAFQLTQNDDQFLDRRVTSRYIPPPPPPVRINRGSGSSTHTFSSGRTHGGGRSFSSGGGTRHTSSSGRSHGGRGRKF